jgi:hypothetical protein
MGKVWGALSLVFALVSLILGWLIIIFVPFGSYIMWALPILAIIFGIIGIIVDDSKGMAIAGLILGIIAIILWPVLGGFILLMIGLSGMGTLF